MRWQRLERSIQAFGKVKIGGSEQSQSTLTVNAEQQRAGAFQVDSYLWHRCMYEMGYRTEGMRGILDYTLMDYTLMDYALTDD